MAEHREAAIQNVADQLYWAGRFDQWSLAKDEAVSLLDAARPHERAAWREELESQEVVEAATASSYDPEDWENMDGQDCLFEMAKTAYILRAAFEAIEEKP